MSVLPPATRAWLEATGFTVRDEAVFQAALTHGSTGDPENYERLEWLGDRVLGLSVSDWLFRLSEAPEGELAQRLNALVARDTCSCIARDIGVPDHVRLGKQARDDGAHDSDNVLGDVMEALIGANFLQAGFDPTRDLVHHLWREAVEGGRGRSKHPKSALQEWAAGNRRRPPEYELVERAGPDHQARFTVRVKVAGVGQVEATATSKQQAETAAAEAFMEQYG
ncbi:ribonuclease III [Tsuneonella sp. HG249]